MKKQSLTRLRLPGVVEMVAWRAVRSRLTGPVMMAARNQVGGLVRATLWHEVAYPVLMQMRDRTQATLLHPEKSVYYPPRKQKS